jgi:hypothetical protein
MTEPIATPKPNEPITTPKPKKMFGGKAVHFEGQLATLEEVFGKAPLPMTDMNKVFWAYIKAHGLCKNAP